MCWADPSQKLRGRIRPVSLLSAGFPPSYRQSSAPCGLWTHHSTLSPSSRGHTLCLCGKPSSPFPLLGQLSLHLGPTLIQEGYHLEIFSITSSAKTLFQNKFTLPDSEGTYLLGSTIPPTEITVRGTDRIREGSGFLCSQGSGSGVFTDEGMAEVSEKRTGVYKGRKETKGILGSSRCRSRESKESV